MGRLPLSIICISLLITAVGAESNPCNYKNENFVLGPANGRPIAKFKVETGGEFKPLPFREVLICERPDKRGSYVIVTEELFKGKVVRNPPQELLGIDKSYDFFGRFYFNTSRVDLKQPLQGSLILVTGLRKEEPLNLWVFVKNPSMLAGMPLLKAFLSVGEIFEAAKSDLGNLSVVESDFEMPKF